METFPALQTLYVTGEFPSQRPATWSFGVFFDLRLNEPLSKQSKRRWFEMLSRSLWHHCNISPTTHHPGNYSPLPLSLCSRYHSCLTVMGKQNIVYLQRFSVFRIFLFDTEPKYDYPHLLQINLIAFLLVYLRICIWKLSLHKHTFHMSLSCINRAD